MNALSVTTTQFLGMIFSCGVPHGAKIEVRIDNGHGVTRFWCDSLAYVVERARPYYSTAKSIWYGPGLRRGNGGFDQDVSWLPALWVDCDAKCFECPSKDEAVERLLAFSPRPSIVVDSGHGAHGYWLLSEYAEGDEIGLASAAMQYLHDRLSEGLPRKFDAVHNPSRVLRLPNTVNRKGDGVPCRVVFVDSDSRLNIRDFPAPARQDGSLLSTLFEESAFEVLPESSDWKELLMGALGRGLPERTKEALFRPEFFVKNDISRLDWAVCCQLTRFLSLSEAELVWLKSPLGNRAGDDKVRSRPDYRRRTLWKAKQTVANGI